jgi:hypothetical protein
MFLKKINIKSKKGLRLGLELGLGFKLGILSHINITLYVCCIFFHNKNNVFGLNFHHFVDFFYCFLCKFVFLQVYVLPSVCFCNF